MGLAGLEQVPVAGLQVPTSWHWSEAAQVTGAAPVQVPPWQVSVRVQALPSLQEEPLGLAGLEQVPVAGLQVPTSWHWSEAVQVAGVPAVQVPAWQVSVRVQALPSLQEEPLGLAGLEQMPVAGLQVPTSWHWSEAVHVTGLLAVQVPAWQVSVRVQALPSLQEEPLGLAGLEQVPVAGLQVPTSWHWSEAAQVTGAAPVQVPPWQVSVRVQALPSLQEEPLGLVGLEQVPVAGLQVPTSWHWSEAGQVAGVPAVQTPAWQVSGVVHALPSLQAAPFGRAVHVPFAVAPVTVLQAKQSSEEFPPQALLQHTPSTQKPEAQS
ncbi:hypothetical protein DAT35_16960 [Vitiosangium sp. GDMCC 1.1324]|nr:hypothetical protein DAT35_16960 [Vitiosangium sp. GDMCC 1.1324]